MPAALQPSRKWNPRSPASTGAFAATPTIAVGRAVRLQELNESTTPTHLACPPRSRHVKNGASNSSRAASPSGMISVAGNQIESDRLYESPKQADGRYSSCEAHGVDGEVLDGETGWASIPPSASHRSRTDSSSNRALGAGSREGGSGGVSGRCGGSASSTGTSCSSRSRSRTAVKISGTGYSERSGGRSNFFFGADFPLSASSGRAESAATSKLPSVPVERKAAAVLGVAGSAGGAPCKAQRVYDVDKQEEEEGQTEVVDQREAKSPDSSSGAGSKSTRNDEAPPAFAPLGPDEEVSAQSNEIEMAPAEQAEVEVHVVFPADLDDGRMGTPDSDDSRKAPSGDSLLGTKSGSTSLLSMLSGSPRSLGTAHDTASGSPSPRTPLPEVSAGGVEGVDKDKDRNVLPSAHPTPLSMFGGDTDLPSDHPTPLSTMGSSKGKGGSRRRSKPHLAAGAATGTGSGSVAPKGAASASGKTKRGDDGSTRGGTNKVVNPAASAFMQRLKYWSGGVAEEHTARSPVSAPPADSAPADADAGADAADSPYRDDVKDLGTKLATGTTDVSNEGSPPVDADAGADAADDPPYRDDKNLGTKIATGMTDMSHEGARSEPGQSAPLSVAESSPFWSEVGVKVVPLDTVTSDAVSVFDSDESQREWRVKPPPPSHHSWVERVSKAADGAVTLRHDDVFASSRPAELEALRRLARDTSMAPGDGDGDGEMVTNAKEVGVERGEVEGEVLVEVDDEVESDMDWDAVSDEENQEEKQQILPPPSLSPPPPPLAEEIEPAPPYSHDHAMWPARGTEAAQQPPQTREGRDALEPERQQQQQPPPPRYMAIVESAIVTSALDLSSTSEHDTSPSEDDGGMMEILTDRLMEACSKIEEVTATPREELSDGATAPRRRGGARVPLSAIRRRQLSTMSSRALSRDQVGGSTHRHGQHSFFSTSSLASSMLPTETEEKYPDSDDDNGAAARKLRRDRVRKRSRAHSRRKLAGALTVPTDNTGETIDVHTAAYSGDVDLVKSYVSQGGDLEVCDKYEATPLMLASERGHTEMVAVLLSAGADVCSVDENGNSALHLACFYGNSNAVELLLAVDVDLKARDAEGRTPLDLATDPTVWRMVRTEEVVRESGESFDLLAAVEVNDTQALGSFIAMGQEACGYPSNPLAVPMAAQRLRIDRQGRGGMSAVHLAAFHGYADALQMLLNGGADPNAICDDGETPLHTACTGGSIRCVTLLLENGANPLATDAKGFVPCEKHIAGGRQDMKRLLESKAFQATPANLMGLRADLAEVALQIDAEEELFVRKGVAIKYLRKALKKKEVDVTRLRQAVDSRDTDLRNLSDRMDSVYRILSGVRRVE